MYQPFWLRRSHNIESRLTRAGIAQRAKGMVLFLTRGDLYDELAELQI
jgi:hypothetical protein